MLLLKGGAEMVSLLWGVVMTYMGINWSSSLHYVARPLFHGRSFALVLPFQAGISCDPHDRHDWDGSRLFAACRNLELRICQANHIKDNNEDMEWLGQYVEKEISASIERSRAVMGELSTVLSAGNRAQRP